MAPEVDSLLVCSSFGSLFFVEDGSEAARVCVRVPVVEDGSWAARVCVSRLWRTVVIPPHRIQMWIRGRSIIPRRANWWIQGGWHRWELWQFPRRRRRRSLPYDESSGRRKSASPPWEAFRRHTKPLRNEGIVITTIIRRS